MQAWGCRFWWIWSFSPTSLKEEICFDDTIPPIYDDYNDECDLFSPPTIEHKVYYDYDMPPIYDD